jgi:hypothetical protein
MLQIDDCITNDYRMKKVAQQHADSNKKPTSRKSSVTGRRKVESCLEVPENLKPFMDRVMKDLKDIRKEIARLPELCAQVTFR